MPFYSYYKLLFFILTAFLLASCISQKSSIATKPKTVQTEVINYGQKYLHTLYRYASQGPTSFDCSGFTSHVFKEFGYNLSPSSTTQAEQVETVRRQEDLQVGDLVFFEGRTHNGIVGHVGIVSDVKRNGRFRFLHASTSFGVIYSYSDEPYYKARYLRGGRVLKNTQPNKKEEDELEPKVYLAQHVPDKANKTVVAKDFSIQKNDNGEENNFTKGDKQSTTHVRNEDGTISVHIKTKSNEEKSVEPEQASKPKKNQNPEEEKDKDQGEIRQSALRFSEESPLPTPIRTTHLVMPGDTLFSISKKHKCSVEQLQKWNPDIENNVIQAGDRLNIYQ